MELLQTLMEGVPRDPVEITAVVLGMICVGCYIRENAWAWPTGIAMVILYFHIFMQAGIYGDAVLQVVYFWLQVYGWREWLRGGNNGAGMRIAWTPRSTKWILMAAGLAMWWAGSLALARWTDSTVPVWDSATTALSLVAQWMIAKKYIENWILWIVVDLLSVPLYLHKGLVFTAGLYVVFLFMAVAGYLQWRKQWRAAAVPVAV
jgi:nicotinamide mononucleotide transporter